jgi:hypothetical protein
MSKNPKSDPLKTHPSDDEQVRVLMELIKAPDHAVAITAAAYLDYAIETLLRHRLRIDPDEDARIFDGAQNGILATASAKITAGYAMRLFEKPVRDDMRSINKVRNIFAHTLHPMTFAHEAVVTQCRKISLIQRRPDMFPDPVNIDARKVYWNTCLDLFTGVQFNIRGIAENGSVRTTDSSLA